MPKSATPIRRNSVIPSIANRFSGSVKTPVKPTARTRSPISFHAFPLTSGSDEKAPTSVVAIRDRK